VSSQSSNTGNGQSGVNPGQMQGAIGSQAQDNPPPDVMPCDKTWIEFRLVDMEGNPIPGKQYLVKLPDGSTQQGALDQAGRTRLEGIQPGTCTISFTELDMEAWERV
jgi:hypothetical protein